MPEFLIYWGWKDFVLKLSNRCILKERMYISMSLKPNLTIDEFRNYWNNAGKTPEGTVKCLIIGVLEAIKEKNPEGMKMWGTVLPKNKVNAIGEPNRTQELAVNQFARQVKGTDFYGAIAASYLGGTQNNGYNYSYHNEIVVDKNQTRGDEKEIKLFVQSGGKDLSSPVRMKKNKYGYWKIFEYSSLFTGVKPVEDDDF